MWKLIIKENYNEICLKFEKIEDVTYIISEIDEHCEDKIEYILSFDED